MYTPYTYLCNRCKRQLLKRISYEKIRIFATAFLLAFTLSSCESFFDVELDDQAKIEDIFR